MIMSAQRDLLAACWLLQPASPADILDVTEQRVNGSGSGLHGAG